MAYALARLRANCLCTPPKVAEGRSPLFTDVPIWGTMYINDDSLLLILLCLRLCCLLIPYTVLTKYFSLALHCIAPPHTVSSSEWITRIFNEHHVYSIITMPVSSDLAAVSNFDNDETTMLPPPRPLPSPAQGPSNPSTSVTAMTSLKRLSLNFPTQPVDTMHHQSKSSISISPDKPSYPSSPERMQFAAPEPNAFLTALAAQERRVMELKEELQKAESDLAQLKKQWVVHEATKKRNEMRHVELLQSLPSPKKPFPVEETDARRVSREEERRKALYVRTKPPQRKVFEGGRHTRTLSLLSPTSMTQRTTPFGMDLGIGASQTDGAKPCLGLDQPPSATQPTRVVEDSPHNSIAAARSDSKGTKEDLVNTGKQLVGDLRQGLWTFIEDLRQATVGDEAINGVRPKYKHNPSLGRSPARNNSRTRAQTTPNRRPHEPCQKVDVVSSLMAHTKPIVAASREDRSSIISTSESSVVDTKPLVHPFKTRKADVIADDDGWDNWDSLPAKISSPTLSTSPQNSPYITSSSPSGSSPRTSMR